jgi:Lon protease-like protein
MTDLADLPIFPLQSVLFPEGALALRVFETRYVDMVRECMHGQKPFGVCRITRGEEVGPAATHEEVGCLASIVDFDMEQLGVLQLRAVGGQRFRVLARRVQDNGLIRADARLIEEDPEIEVPAQYEACPLLLQRILGDLESREPGAAQRLVTAPHRYDSAGWVANRLCEFLPISPKARQQLMELPDPLVRLSLVHQYLEQHRVV